MGGASLAIVEKKPQFGSGAGGCAGGVLFHLLDWHRRLARKRRLFSPRRLLPTAVRSSSSSTRRLLPPTPSPATPPRPAPSTPDGPAAPGVVARLMGLESWPSGASPAAAPRPQKQRKVEAAASAGGDGDTVSEVVVMLPLTRRPPAHAPPRSHHSADLPARSPRRARFVHAAAARLLEPAGARVGSRARLAYACSSPQHRGHAGGTLEDFLARSDSPAPPDAERDNAVSSRWQQTQRSIDTMSSNAAAAAGVEMSGTSDTIVVPRTDFCEVNTSTNTSDEDALRKDYRARNGGMGSCAGVRSSRAAGGSARAGEQRPLRKRGTLSRPDAPRSVGSGNLASLTRSIGNARELTPGGCSRRTANNSGPVRESMSSITLPRSNRRELVDRSGSASIDRSSTSRNVSNAPGPRRGSHKKSERGTPGSNNRGDRSAAAFSSSSSMRPVSRTSSLGKVSEKREFRGTQYETSCTRMPVVVDAKSLEAEHCVVGATSEKEEFSRLLKAKIDELGLSDKVEPSESHSANLTVSLLQELISALNDDTNISASQSSYGSDCSAPLKNAETVCNSSDQSTEFDKLYQFQGDQEAVFSVTCTNDDTNQPSPTSVLEACFSNDASSLGSPIEKNEGKEFFVSMENKMEDLFNLESDIVDLAMSIDTTKSDVHGSSGEMPHIESITAHDFKFLECRLHSIGEAISNAELLLDGSLFCGSPSSLSLHSFIVEMLEAVEDLCGGPEILGFKDENRYQRTNFLFDCIVESLDSRFCSFGKCGYKAWLRLPLTLSKDLLKREVSEEIGTWRDTTGGNSLNQANEKELDQVAAGWDACRVEAFDISVAIEDDILEALVGEFAFDQC